MEQERERGSITAAITTSWKIIKSTLLIRLVTLTSQLVERSMRVLDGVAVFCSVGGAAAIRDGMATGRSVQGAWIAFVNKMDRGELL